MKKFFSILLAALMLLTMAACGNGDSNTSSSPSETSAAETSSTAETSGSKAETGSNTSDSTYKIGVSLYDLSNEYFQYMQEGIEEAATELGAEIVSIHDQKNDEAELLTGCENLINQGIDALVVSPCKPEVMSTIVDAAHEKDIPVVILDIGDGGSDKDVIVVSNMYGGGEIAGKYALDLLEAESVTSGEFAIIKCEESAVYAIQRGEGFKDVLTEAGFECVKEITANSDQTEGYNAMQDIMSSSPDVKVVFAENDNMALGASEAINDAGKAGEILVFGFDGNDSAVEAIKDGSLSGTIAQQPVEIGSLGIELAIDLINGETLSFDNDSTKEIYADVYLIDNAGEKNTEYTAG